MSVTRLELAIENNTIVGISMRQGPPQVSEIRNGTAPVSPLPVRIHDRTGDVSRMVAVTDREIVLIENGAIAYTAVVSEKDMRRLAEALVHHFAHRDALERA